MSHLVDNFLEMKQTSDLADWVPMYKLAGEDAGMPVDETTEALPSTLSYNSSEPRQPDLIRESDASIQVCHQCRST